MNETQPPQASIPRDASEAGVCDLVTVEHQQLRSTKLRDLDHDLIGAPTRVISEDDLDGAVNIIDADLVH
jgi:hypothetical protein